MRSLSILYLGAAYGTSLHRAQALERLGHAVEIADPRAFLPTQGLAGRVAAKLIYEFGGDAFEAYVRGRLARRFKGCSLDLVWVDSGELLGPKAVRTLRRFAPRILNYNHDDPFGPRDKRRFSLYRQAVPFYDLLVVVRRENVAEAKNGGAHKVILVTRPADEVAHAPLVLSEDERAKWRSDVVFVGSWMPERGAFLTRLRELGVPLTIYGGRWEKAREWPSLSESWRGPDLHGADYVRALQCAGVCLGLLSHGNRDLHTTRTAEITYIGSVLCAERTSEHEALFVEDQEAVFWTTPEECAQKCVSLLQDPDRRTRIAQAGRKKCIANGMLNQVVLSGILEALPSGGDLVG